MAHDIFISYSSKDKPIADGICANLEAAGLRCWVAPRDIMPGEDFPSAIAKAISSSQVFVLVFSQNANMSDDVSNELYLAFNNKVIIVPFKIEDVQPVPGKAYYLGRTHWLDAMSPPTLAQINNLIDTVNSYLTKKAETAKPRIPENLPELKQKRSFWLSALIVVPILLALGIFFLPKLGSATGNLDPISTVTAQTPPVTQPESKVIATSTVQKQSTPTLELVAQSSDTPPSTTDASSPYLFWEDFDDPESEGVLPINMFIIDDRCKDISINQENGSLIFRVPEKNKPWCVVEFTNSGNYYLQDLKAAEFTLRTSKDTDAFHPSFGPILGGRAKTSFDNPSGDFMLFCTLGPNNCVVKEGANTIFQSKSFREKPGDTYTFRIEVLDPVNMKFRFIVNNEMLGEYTLPSDKTEIYQGITFHMNLNLVDGNFTKKESEMHLESIGIVR